MKVLVIEKDLVFLDFVKRYLKREGCICESATTYKEAFKKINNHEYDCVILEPEIAGGDGLQLIKILRAEDTQTGIIVTSACNTLHDRIQGLNLGADDYLGKPFDISELHARMKAILRRKTNFFKNDLHFGDLIIRQHERTVLAQQTPLKLTKKEYNILLFLVRNKNRIMTKESIAEHLWGDDMDDAVSFDFIYAHVKNLRKKLVEQGCGDFLKTIYGVGYKFQST